MGIAFVSKEEIEAQRQAVDAARAARVKAAEEARRAEGARRKEKVATGETTWVAPALERRLQHKEKKEKKGKKERKKDKHKHKRMGERSADQRVGSQAASGSDSSDDEMPAAASSVGGVSGGAPLDRDAAGLSFMMKTSARPAGAVSARAGAAASPVEDLAAAADAARAKARLDRELNPYAAAGKDSSEWTRDGVACFSHASQSGATSSAHATPAVRAAETDGGASWKQKQLLRAVEHARNSGEALQEVCLTRFGTLDSLSEMERISQRLDSGPAEGKGGGSRGGGGNPRAHLQAIAARQRAYRKQEEKNGASADGAGGGMLRPSISGSLSWGGRGRGKGAAEGDEAGDQGGDTGLARRANGKNIGRPEGTPQLNHFRNDGKFLTSFLEDKDSGDAGRKGETGGGTAASSRAGRAVEVEEALNRKAVAADVAERKASVAAGEAERDAARAEQRRAFLYGGGGEGDASALGPRVDNSSGAGEDEFAHELVAGVGGRAPAVASAAGGGMGGQVHGRGAAGLSAAAYSRDLSHIAFAAAPVADVGMMGKAHGTGAAALSTAASVGVTPSAAAAAATPALDANQLMAKALRAKLMGNKAEYERLQGLAAAAPPHALPPPLPPPLPPTPGEARAEGEGGGGGGGGRGGGGSVELLVPESAVGLLLGKGGSAINAMAAESGARIRLLNESDPETGQRVVLLRGGSAEVDKAQLLLEAKLNESAEREAQRGGSKASRQAAKRARRDDRPATTIQMVPEFDAATGQLKIVERRVEVEAVAGSHRSYHAEDQIEDASTKRPKIVQRYDKETGERARFFRDDDDKSSLSALVAETKRGSGKGMDDHYANNVSRMGRKYVAPPCLPWLPSPWASQRRFMPFGPFLLFAPMRPPSRACTFPILPPLASLPSGTKARLLLTTNTSTMGASRCTTPEIAASPTPNVSNLKRLRRRRLTAAPARWRTCRAAASTSGSISS
jgi:hypothetical protein